jgi:mannosyl-oligosaccharide alpha-1,2-mannosidase
MDMVRDLKSNIAEFKLKIAGETVFAALTTAILMEERDIVHRILGHVQKVDFLNGRGSIDVAKGTARYLGSIISAYDLLKGPYSQLLDQVGQN